MSDFDPRQLEWQRRYEEQDTPWDKGRPAPPLLGFLKEHPVTGRVLVPGCGKGHDARLLAENPEARVLGLDLAPSALEHARRLIEPARHGDRIDFQAGDYFALGPEHLGAYDWVLEHTCFCAIDPKLRRDYARVTASLLKPGGHFLAIFYLTPGVEKGPPFGAERAELDSLFGPAFDLQREWVPAEAFPGREGAELVRHYRRRA